MMSLSKVKNPRLFGALAGVDASPKPVLRRLLPPLSAMVILLIAGAGMLLWQQQQQRLDEKTASNVAIVNRELRMMLDNQVSGLAAALQPIAASPGVRKALRERDTDRLLADWRPVFETLHRENHITHFYFFDTNRVCLLRVHKPEKRGDLINRFTAIKAERTGKTASGIELGPLGTFTMRVVQPVFAGGKLVGYVELGKEIEDVLQTMHTCSGNELVVVIRKEYLGRQGWEDGMRLLGRDAEWDRLPRSAVIYTSHGRLTDALATWADHFAGDHAHGEANREIAFDGKNWQVSAVSLQDASGKEVGHLLIERDITPDKTGFARFLVLALTGAGVLLALLLSSIYILLRRTDAGIRAQQAELQESKEHLSATLRSIGDGVIATDVEGRVTDLNSVAEVLTGWSTAETIGRPIDEVFRIVNAETRQKAEIPVDRALREDRIICLDNFTNLIARNGEDRLIADSCAPIHDVAGAVIGAVLVFRDVSEEYHWREKLRESESRLLAITESAQDAILMMDPEGRVSYWNPAAGRILGYASDEAIGQNLHALIAPPCYHEAHRAAFPGFLRTGQGAAVGKTLDLEARRKDGVEIVVQLSLSAIRLKNGWYAVGLLRDITEHKRSEEAIQESNRCLEEAVAHASMMAEQAELANRAKGEFLANMSHEIRTPMNGVIGMTGLLLDTELSDEQRRYAETVRNSGESLLGLINDILDFSKIEAGKLEMETLDFDLRALLDDFAATLAVRAHEKGLEFICAAAPDVPALLRGDPGRLRQILTNLTGNAVKFTHQGEIAVQVSLVSETNAEAVLRFSIKDTGIGIPVEKQEMMFQKFTQADASTTRRYGGTGLGLAISKELVERMGGEIGVISPSTSLRAGEEGDGSEFWFTARLGKQPEREVNIAPPTDIRGVHVLVVDDNATNREVLMAQFAAWGLWAEAAPDGPSALRELHRARDAGAPFRVAILDMQMPGMDGAALARAIKADETIMDTLLVLLTSLGQRGDARKMKDIGFAAYLTKPARQSELFGCLSAVLSGTAVAQPAWTIVTRHTVRELRRGGARILLAEDNITNQQVALGILRKLGMSADAVADGAEALKALETIPYDLVLMDVQMPEMDGIEATRRIRDPRSAVSNHGIPIIAMTAHAMRGDRERCLEAGMNDYVTKPVDPQALAEALRKWLPKGIGECGMRNVEYEETNNLSTPIFDRTGMMARLMNDEDLARTLTECFLEDIPRRIEALRGSLVAGDVPGVECQAHTIKGSAANMGGERLREVAFRMEKAGKAGDLDVVKALMADLEMQFDTLKETMTKETINP